MVSTIAGLTPQQLGTPFGLTRAQSQLNRINQQTPFGGLTFTGPDRNTAELGLSPALQGIFDQKTGFTSDALTGALGRLQGLPSGAIGSDPATRNAIFDRSTQLLTPQLERDEERLRTRLANQGIPMLSPAFEQAFSEQFTEPRNELLDRLALSATIAGGQEERANRSQLFNELGSLLGTQQVDIPELGDFFSPSAVDVTSPQNLDFNRNAAGQSLAFNQEQLDAAEEAAIRGELFGLGSAAISGIGRAGGIGPFFEGLGDLASGAGNLITSGADLLGLGSGNVPLTTPGFNPAAGGIQGNTTGALQSISGVRGIPGAGQPFDVASLPGSLIQAPGSPFGITAAGGEGLAGTGFGAEALGMLGPAAAPLLAFGLPLMLSQGLQEGGILREGIPAIGEGLKSLLGKGGNVTPFEHGMGNAAAAFAEVMGGDVDQHGMAGAPQGQVIAADWLMQRGGQAAVDSFYFHISQPNTDVGAALKRAAIDSNIPFESGNFGMSIADIAAEQAND